MLKTHIKKLPYFIFTFLLFVLLPIAYHFFNNKSEAMINMVVIIFTTFTFIVSLIYSYNNEDFSYSFAIFTGICFLISCVIFWNFEIYIYALLYIFLSLCGQGSGYVVKKLVRFIKYLYVLVRRKKRNRKLVKNNKKNS
ncbi:MULTISPECIES: hypothetical protein [unclassified Gemella]|uniref:hypothetical protein n=1 Tax=unclassified Gemella TaxID=2624949 RepID=UPI0010737944|nr:MULTISPECIES: hypothetical protein [unclassified Gemella]MBF0710063.1 hypothetical protein [Gemella sp. GL1.1]MBF0746142.1 hypothetical protein [Gemella sp. 19428wG2_WT2a]NYS27407.1 hypothetical protein [Gemella sp. GL1]TFU60430.1 hypothetical protein E4T67_00385 [Gemella sp. WT2a]